MGQKITNVTNRLLQDPSKVNFFLYEVFLFLHFRKIFYKLSLLKSTDVFCHLVTKEIIPTVRNQNQEMILEFRSMNLIIEGR